jgi:hypothetical protein
VLRFDARIVGDVAGVFPLALEVVEAEGSVGVWRKVRSARMALPEGLKGQLLPRTIGPHWLVVATLNTADRLPHKSPKYLIKINQSPAYCQLMSQAISFWL